jgi:hypothetical protein
MMCCELCFIILKVSFLHSHTPNNDVRKFPYTDVFSMASDKEYKQNKVLAICVCVCSHMYTSNKSLWITWKMLL